MFFAYSNGRYHLTEFAFGGAFGELAVKRSRAFLLDESPLADLDLPRLLAERPPEAEPRGPFPQANDLDTLADLVRLAASEGLSKEAIAGTFGFDERQGDYYGNAACYLGLLRRAGGLFEAAPEGLAFAALRTRSDRTAALVGRMLAVPSLRAALELLVRREYRLEKIAPGELAALIEARTSLRASTPARRASTVRAWLAWVMGNVKIRF